MVHLGIQCPLSQRLLQFIQQAALLESRPRLSTGQQLV
jgi:hypothetical protein